ncbi:hypothetical protein [Cellulosimicrobium sp. 22601]|uniref:hypothetical protein n=1 Tax=unclassified Cellulosimicrobium TaxID=2624466 RepID=UPI003F861445
MKQQIIQLGDRVAPGLMERARTRSRAHLAREIEVLKDELRELRVEIDECRRDNIRIAEIADVVEANLAGRPAA